jgi:hypothetical protein
MLAGCSRRSLISCAGFSRKKIIFLADYCWDAYPITNAPFIWLDSYPLPSNIFPPPSSSSASSLPMLPSPTITDRIQSHTESQNEFFLGICFSLNPCYSMGVKWKSFKNEIVMFLVSFFDSEFIFSYKNSKIYIYECIGIISKL